MLAGQQNGLTDDAQNRSVNWELSSRFLTGIRIAESLPRIRLYRWLVPTIPSQRIPIYCERSRARSSTLSGRRALLQGSGRSVA